MLNDSPCTMRVRFWWFVEFTVQDAVQSAMRSAHPISPVWVDTGYGIADRVHDAVGAALCWCEERAMRKSDHPSLDRFIDEIEQKWSAACTTR